MRVARAVLAALLLIVLFALAFVIVDERCSLDLGGVEMTWEEVARQVQRVDLGGTK